MQAYNAWQNSVNDSIKKGWDETTQTTLAWDAVVLELFRRAGFAKGQIAENIGLIMQALGELSKVQNFPEVDRAWSLLSDARSAGRIAIAELDGTARAGEPREAAE